VIALDALKQEIMANIDTLTGKILSFKMEDIENRLSDSHLFYYTINRFKDNDGKEYKILSTVTIAQDVDVKESGQLIKKTFKP
jgi:hypothetical protein